MLSIISKPLKYFLRPVPKNEMKKSVQQQYRSTILSNFSFHLSPKKLVKWQASLKSYKTYFWNYIWKYDLLGKHLLFFYSVQKIFLVQKKYLNFIRICDDAYSWYFNTAETYKYYLQKNSPLHPCYMWKGKCFEK